MVENNLKVVLGSTSSDSHIWNLIYLELLMLEHNCEVINLGSCVPKEAMLAAIQQHQPDLVVVTSLNGTLYQDGISLIEDVKRQGLLAASQYIIGGQVSDPEKSKNFIEKKLLKHGYNAAFIMGDTAERFKSYLCSINTQLSENQIAV